MPKELDFSDALSAETTVSTPFKSPESTRSTSSAKYRVSSRPNNIMIQTSIETPDAAPYFLESRRLTTDFSSILQHSNKNSGSQVTSSGLSATATTSRRNKSKNRFAIAIDAVTSSKTSGNPPKLPQKLRQHVTRLRSQLTGESSRTLNIGGQSSSPTVSSHIASRSSLSSTDGKRFSNAATALQYSRRSTQLLKPNATKDKEKLIQPEIQVSKASGSQNPESVVSAATFQALLRPLQSKLSCASLTTGWSSDEDDEAEQLFRQSERENSRLLRVCCSIDNLMLSIGDQAQEQKQSEAIVRGATRDLVKLYHFAIKQVVSVIFDKMESDTNNNSIGKDENCATLGGKEAKYAMEFLLEINDRIGKLHEFTRSVFVNVVDELRLRMTNMEEELAVAAVKNEQLQSEMRDLQDFHEQNNSNLGDSFTIGGSGTRHPVLDTENDTATMVALTFSEISTEFSGENECGVLKQQCQELSRLLEMAKQEIRLSHHERDGHKARSAELSSALFRDTELSFLRNQLQSEKKRVRTLERENLTLRESQQEQSLKLQSTEDFSTGTVSTAIVNSDTLAPVARSQSTIIGPSIEPILLSLPQDRNQLIEEEAVVSSTQLTLKPEIDEYNFIHSDQRETVLTVPINNWFSGIVNPPEPINTRKSHKNSKPEPQSPVVLSRFLADLLLTNKQIGTSAHESKTRRQGNVPTLNPPTGIFSSTRDLRSSNSQNGSGRKRRPQSAAPSTAPVYNVDHEAIQEEIVTGCLQLIWTFYQRFLLAVEAQNLLGTRGIGGDPMMGSGIVSSAGNPATEPVSLSRILFHFFLARCRQERDAVHELEMFVRCVHRVRHFSYSLELFCQFLEETRSRQELCFFLWVCQAIDEVRLGIPYDDPQPSYEGSTGRNDGQSQYICVLKATFLSRTIFRLFNFKVLCRPLSKAKRRGKGKQSSEKQHSNINSEVTLAPSSPLTSPKRKHQTRLGERTAALASTAPFSPENHVDISQDEHDKLPPHVAAQTELRGILENNPTQPISLETFNNLLLKFAIVPSSEELAARLGPFFHPTGEERKIPKDVFLSLLMEVYKFQLQWQRDQLGSLFIHLNHQEDVQQRAAEKMIQVDKESHRQGSKETTRIQPKSHLKRRKRREGTAENGGGGSKYLRGLSRNVLREFLLQSGIVTEGDMVQLDMDWLFAQILESAGGKAAEISFDGVFNALSKMKWLDSSQLRVDTIMEMTGIFSHRSLTKKKIASEQRIGTRKTLKASSAAIPSSKVRTKWRVFARHSLALCMNDPNVFIRRHSQRLLHYVDHHLEQFAIDSESEDFSVESIQCIREFLAFAWRVAAKRSGKGENPLSQSCLTEVFLVSQAVRSTFDSFSGYPEQLEEPQPGQLAGNSEWEQSRSIITRDSLKSFYDTARMNLTSFIKDKDSATVRVQMNELESVLLPYATHLAHLFHRFSEARFNSSPQVSFHRWTVMVSELGLVHSTKLPFSKLQILFMNVVSSNSQSIEKSLNQEFGVGKTQFSELFVLIAIERHRVAVARKLDKAQQVKKSQGDQATLLEAAEVADRLARIMAAFCRDILALRAFGGDNTLVERNFAAKLSCPLVGRALLEHRAFLRTVFFYYAKQDEVAEDAREELEEQNLMRELQENRDQMSAIQTIKEFESSVAVTSAVLQQLKSGSDFQLEKTKRSSMSFGEFETFLTAFCLLDVSDLNVDYQQTHWRVVKVSRVDAQHIFSAVMSLENDDTLQLEFDEFAAAIVALAVHLNPSPFTLWHQKLDDFAKKLQRMWEVRSAETIEKE